MDAAQDVVATVCEEAAGCVHAKALALAHKRLEALTDCLISIAAEADDRSDVEDGSDGEPQPNVWMRLAQSIDEAFSKASGTP